MSDVNPRDTRLIESADDVLHAYQGVGENAKTGVEIELTYFDPADLAPMSPPQNRVVKSAADATLDKNWVRNEPTSETLEVAGLPFTPDNLQAVMDDANLKIATLSEKAASIGLKRSYFQDLPDRSAAQLLKSIVDVQRYQAFFNPPRTDMMDIAAYFAVCKSNQVSVSYRDPDHMLENVRRLYFLAPFLFMLTDNSSSYNEGKPFPGHNGMHHRASLGKRGGVYPYLFTAKSGAEYIAAHVDHVMNNPLYVYYNEKGEMVRLPSGTWTSFNELRAQELNTATNYYFAQTVLWPDVKIAALKDETGEVVAHRYEARMFGVGMHQHQTALLIVAGLGFNPDFAARTNHLLASYGFTMTDPPTAEKILTASYKEALHHDGRFFDIAYGTGRMDKFARQFADLLEDTYAGSAYEDAIAPALLIARTGCTDAKINRLLFPTLEDIQNFQRSFDPAIFENPNSCARMIFEKELGGRKSAARSCSAF